MKKLLLIMLFFLIAAAVFAGGTENKSNLSIGYLMNMSRNTETERPDAVFYNPAGTAFMKDGLYIDIGNQFVFKDYSHEVTSPSTGYGTYETDNIIYLYPNAELVFKKDNFAIFGAFGVFGGGGLLEYDNGTYLSQTMLNPYKFKGATDSDIANSFDIYSIVYGEIVGASYVFKDKISVAAAIRFLQGNQTLEATLDNNPSGAWAAGGPLMPGLTLPPISSKSLLKTEASANGIGGIFSVHFKPIEELDLAVMYQTITKMEYEFDTVEGSLAPLAANVGVGYKEGNKFNKDLPAVLGIGVGYRIIESLYTSLSFNYYFNKQADNDEMSYNDSWEIAAGANYDLSKKVSFSLGALYSKQGISETKNMAEAPNLDSFTIGAGTSLKLVKNLVIDIAAFKPFYFGEDFKTTVAGTDIEMELEKKNMLLLGIGISYKFF